MNYDLPRSFCGGVDGLLWERFSGSSARLTKMAYDNAGPHADDLRDLFAPLLSGLLWHAERFGVGGVGEVTV